MTLVCSTCAKQITPRSKSGLCRSCSMKQHANDPAKAALRLAALRAALSTPEYRDACRTRTFARFRDPAARQKVSEGARRASTPEVTAKRALNLSNWQANNDHDFSATARLNAAKRRAWCPTDLWPEYERMRAKMGAVEAKRIMQDEIARRERARVAALSPFERQDEKLRNGAGLIAAVAIRRAGHAGTLGGVSSGMLA